MTHLKTRTKRKLILFAAALAISAASLLAPELFSVPAADTPQNAARVARVVDGDTVKLETGETVRYIGIDTPETVHPDKTVQCFGKEASAKNKELVEGKEVRLERDVSDRDRYGRLLRYVYVGDVMINEALVAEGFARTATFPPDVKYVDTFKNAERIAREGQKGLWVSCTGA